MICETRLSAIQISVKSIHNVSASWGCGFASAWRISMVNRKCFMEFHKLHTVQCLYNMVNFLQNLHERHPIARPSGPAMGCIFWAQPLIDILPKFLQWCVQYHVILYWIITTLDCATEFRNMNGLYTETCLKWVTCWRQNHKCIFLKWYFFYFTNFCFGRYNNWYCHYKFCGVEIANHYLNQCLLMWVSVAWPQCIKCLCKYILYITMILSIDRT